MGFWLCSVLYKRTGSVQKQPSRPISDKEKLPLAADVEDSWYYLLRLKWSADPGLAGVLR